MSNITYHSLSDYVGGSCITKTFQLDGLTHSDHLTEISQWLTSITARLKDGELREEWIVCDYEDVPADYVGEYSIDESFFDLMEAINNSHLDAEIFNAGVACGINVDDIEDLYYGSYSSDAEFGEMIADGCLDIPEHIEIYFDYASYGRDMAHDFAEFDGHYFFNH